MGQNVQLLNVKLLVHHVTGRLYKVNLLLLSPYLQLPIVSKMVKVTLVQALRLCTGRTAHRGGRGIALLFHDQRH